jgi:flagellar FliL protein
MTMPRVILLMLVLNMAIALGGIAFNYYQLESLRAGVAAPVGAAEAVAETAGEPEEQAEYTFFPVEKVIVSLPDEGREHYFVLDLVLQADIEAEIKKLEQLDPMVRNSAVAYLSGLRFDELRGMPIAELQTALEKALFDDFAGKKLAVPFVHVLVSKLIVQ